MLVRSIRRRREIAVRLALGARAATLLRQAIVESVVLSIAGGMIGLGLAAAALRLGVSLRPDTLPRVREFGRLAGDAVRAGAGTHDRLAMRTGSSIAEKPTATPGRLGCRHPADPVLSPIYCRPARMASFAFHRRGPRLLVPRWSQSALRLPACRCGRTSRRLQWVNPRVLLRFVVARVHRGHSHDSRAPAKESGEVITWIWTSPD